MGRQFKRQPLTMEEADRLQAACSTFRERLAVWGLLDTGLRVHEWAKVRPDDISWQGRRLSVVGKGNKARIVPLTDRVLTMLENHFALEQEMPWAVRTLQRIVHTVADRARIVKPCSAHVLRHSFAVFTLQKGISLRTLQMILGHESIQVTERYLNLAPEDALGEFRAKW